MNTNKVREVAKLKKITIRDLAEAIGMSETGFHQALKDNTLKVNTLLKISQVLKVPIDIFFKEDENTSSSEHTENNNSDVFEEKLKVLQLENYKLKEDIYKVEKEKGEALIKAIKMHEEYNTLFKQYKELEKERDELLVQIKNLKAS